MNTLFADDINDKTCIGKGLFVTQIKKDLLIYNQQGFVEKKSMNDNFEKRLAAVELVRNHGAMKSRLVEFLEGLSTRQTLDNCWPLTTNTEPKASSIIRKIAGRKTPNGLKAIKPGNLSRTGKKPRQPLRHSRFSSISLLPASKPHPLAWKVVSKTGGQLRQIRGCLRRFITLKRTVMQGPCSSRLLPNIYITFLIPFLMCMARLLTFFI
jgi:hypothetical protein